MKSKISFFNRGISRNLLRRFWPLWASYLALLLLLVPGSLSQQADSVRRGVDIFLDGNLVKTGNLLVYFSAAVGVAAAMAMYHYLYQTRSCTMMNTLPVRRETMFCTAWLTGLVPLLLADLLTMLLTALLLCPGGYVSVRALFDWLTLVVLGNITFYGFSVFCAMLTGSLMVLPVVYAVLNFAVVVAESCARNLLQSFVFGMRSMGCTLDFLSPIVRLLQTLRVSTDYTQRVYTVEGLGVLGLYCAVSLALPLAALLLYRRRRMETATDVVAIPILKPVFKYCLCIGTALVFAYVLDSMFFDLTPGGRANPWITLLQLFVGAFIGYFAAEMLMQKTLRVFRGHWRGFLAACAALTLFVCAFEFDVFGYERRVPDAERVETVRLESVGESAELSEAAEIAAALDFHRAVIADKAACDREDGCYLQLSYLLKDGSVMARAYRLPTETLSEPDSLMRRAEALLNSPSAILARVQTELPVTRRTIAISRIDVGRWMTDDYSGEDVFAYGAYELTTEEALSLYSEGLLPDAQAGHIGRAHLVTDEAYYENTYPLEVRIDLRGPDAMGYRSYSFISVGVEADSVNTLRWIEEHTDLELRTFAELGIGPSYGVG